MTASDLTILGQGGADEAPADVPKTVLITGARTPLGLRLREAWDEVYDLIALAPDDGGDDADAVFADLAEPDDEWMDAFLGVDVVVHIPEDAPGGWADATAPGLDAVANVCNAAVLAGVERVVSIGSARSAEYEAAGADAAFPPDATSLWVAERLGRALSAAFAITYVAARCQADARRSPSASIVDAIRSLVDEEIEPGSFVIADLPPRPPDRAGR